MSISLRLDFISAVLFALTLVRMALVIGAQPIAAYANNYDFIRESSCVGVWEAYTDGRPKTDSDPQQAADPLIYDRDRRRWLCVFSSDNLFPWFLTRWHKRGAHLFLHTIGWAKFIVAALVLLAVLSQPVWPKLRLAFAVAALLIFGDIATLSYFSTLYTEGSVAIFGFASAALVIALFCRDRRPTWRFGLLLLATLVWLALARQQWAPWAVTLGLLAAFGLWRRWGDVRLAWCAVLLSVAAVAGLMTLHARNADQLTGIEHANLVDTVMATVLPAATDKPAALRRLGLPDTCLAAIGLNWYAPAWHQHEPCPAVYHVSRLRLPALFVSQPATLLAPLAQGVNQTRPAYLPEVAHFERPSDADRPTFRFLAATSLSVLLAALPQPIYAGIIVAACALGLLGLCVVLLKRRDLEPWLLLGTGGCLALYALISSVFGDGLYDVQRHAFALLIGLPLQLSAGFCVWAKERKEVFFFEKKNQKTFAH